jgi:hypothetical protein
MAATQDVAPFSTDVSHSRSKVLTVLLIAFAVLAAVALVGMFGVARGHTSGSGPVIDLSRVDHRGYPEKALP